MVKQIAIIEPEEEAVVRAFHGTADIYAPAEQDLKDPVRTYADAQEEISFYLIAGLMATAF